MKVIAFGEIMLRLSPEGYGRFVQSDRLEMSYGGAEANTAVSLAGYGVDTAFVTKLPEHEMGQAAVNALRRYGVDTGKIVRGGDRVGIYFCEKGASQRPSKVIYDRKGSAIATAKREDFDWEKILDGADWFHFSGITPAISDSAAEITLDAVKAAKKKGLTVSCDVNYRKKLLSREKFDSVMSELMNYVDIAKDFFGVDTGDITKLSKPDYERLANEMCEKFALKAVAVTMRESLSASDNNWSAMLFANGKAHFSTKYNMHIVDRVGGGDSFFGGLIYSLLNGFEPQKAVEFATAASCLKHSVEGDFNLMSAEEVEALAGGNASGNVQR